MQMLEKKKDRGAWVAQLVKQPILDFSSGHDLTVHGFKPCIRLCTDSMEPTWDSLPVSILPLLVCAVCMRSLFSLKINKTKKIFK